MPPRTEEQFEEIRNEKTKLIMQSALQLFANNGYDNTSISQIAKDAGISKGLMYNYFDSKEALIKTIMLSGINNFMVLLQVKDKENIKRDEIEFFVNGNMELLKQNIDYYKLFFSLAFQPKIFQILGDSFMKISEDVTDIFVKYFTQKGEEKPYVKARLILALFDGIGIHYVIDKEHFPIEDIREIIIEMI